MSGPWRAARGHPGLSRREAARISLGVASLLVAAALVIGQGAIRVVQASPAYPAPSASPQTYGTFVTGFVYYDLNGHGQWDPGEPKAPGASISWIAGFGGAKGEAAPPADNAGNYVVDVTGIGNAFSYVDVVAIVNNAAGSVIAYGRERVYFSIGQTTVVSIGLRFVGSVNNPTHFGVDAVIGHYSDDRGGVATFGYPISRLFLFQGFPTQIFQRVVLQEWPDGSVHLLNLLDPGLLPFSSFNGAVVPAYDPALVAQAPAPGSPGYIDTVMQFVQANAPNTFAGQPVNFGTTFFHTVSASTAHPPILPLSYCRQRGLPDSSCTPPPGYGNRSLLPGFDLEIWGIPTSLPMVDPRNHQFVYQRFQRGILHYQADTNTTEGLLLGDYFKEILTDQHLPPDVAAEAANSPYLDQYCPSGPHWICRPDALDPTTTDLTGAFEPEAPGP